MADRYLAGIDIGTTGAKTALFTTKGDMIASGYREYACSYPKANWVEQDPDQLVSSGFKSAKSVLETSGIDPSSICAISLSAQRSCTIFVDKNGEAIRPMISWQDARTTAELEDIAQILSPDEFYALTGLPHGATWIISKILWLRKNEPEAWKRVHKVVQLHDYMLKALGADEFYEDIPDTVFFGIWDTDNFTWSDRLLQAFDITQDMLPLPKPSGTLVGSIGSDAAKRTGFLEGTPLCVGAGDQNSAVVGAGIVQSSLLSVSMGTGGIAITYLDKPFRDPSGMSMVTNHAIQGKWQLEGLQAGAAGVFRWFRDEVATLEKEVAREQNRDPYDLINELIAKTPVGAKGLLFLPYLASATAPRWNAHARGTLTGLTFAHDRGCLARAFIEGITLEMKDILTSMLSSGIDVDTVRIMGGATKSSIWNQIQADVYNRPVQTLKVADAALLGAAIFAGTGSGCFKDIREAVDGMVVVDSVCEPVQENAEIYDELYNIYCRVYEGMDEREVFEKLSCVQNRY
jgi:xylulokinase